MLGALRTEIAKVLSNWSQVGHQVGDQPWHATGVLGTGGLDLRYEMGVKLP